MASQIPWDKYEAVILLEAWLQVTSGVPETQIINLVSYKLRLKAVNQGLEIDDTFRNTNGIRFQLLRMATAFEKMDMGLSATKLFSQTVNLYENDQSTYQKLKDEAMKMVAYSSEIKDGFSEYVRRVVPNSSIVILKVVDYMDDFAISIKAFTHSIFENPTDETISILRKKVINHKYFAVRYKKYMPFAKKGLRLLADYIKEISVGKTDDIENDDNRSKYLAILSQEFDEGYCIGDYLHRTRFLSAYNEKYGEDLELDMDEVEQILERVGQVRNHRIYCPANSDSSLLLAIYEDLKTVFDSGATAVYYDYLFERHSDRLASEMSVYSVDALITVIRGDSNFPKEYRALKQYIARRDVTADTDGEVKSVIMNCHMPVTFEEIQAQVPYIPMRRIKNTLMKMDDVVNVGEGTVFYAPNFYISTDETTVLIRAVHSALSEKGFLAAKDLRLIFKKACPLSAMNSGHLKDYGLMNILKVLLRGEFEFSSSTITEIGERRDYGQVFQDYAARRERLSLNELLELKNELGSVIYWDSVFKEMIRISETEFVRKGTVEFNVPAVDKTLEEMCPDEYTPLKDITLFLSLPPASVRWNGFLLESFLREYSKKFRLVQLSVSQDDYFGVMLKRSSKLDNYNDVAADMLAKSHDWSDEKSALQLLKAMNFQQRAANRNISSIIKAAKQKRINIE